MIYNTSNPFNGVISAGLWVAANVQAFVLATFDIGALHEFIELMKAVVTVSCPIISTFVLIAINWNKLMKFFRIKR